MAVRTRIYPGDSLRIRGRSAGTALFRLCCITAAMSLYGAFSNADGVSKTDPGRSIRNQGQDMTAIVRPPRLPGASTDGLMRLINGRAGMRASSPNVFLVDVLTPRLHAEIAAQQGVYPVEPVLSVRVTASDPCWTMKIKAIDLQHDEPPHGRKIAAHEICWVNGDGEQMPLRAPVLVAPCGPAGVTLLELPLEIVTASNHDPGCYSGFIEIITTKAHGATPKTIKVPLSVCVTMHISHTIRDNKIYFHFADLPATQKAVISGDISSDASLHLSVSTQLGRIDRLPLSHAWSRFFDPPADSSIGLVWKLAEGPAGHARAPDLQPSGGKSLVWLLAGTPGTTSYQLELGISPEAYQAPGDYGMEVTVTLQPCL